MRSRFLHSLICLHDCLDLSLSLDLLDFFFTNDQPPARRKHLLTPKYRRTLPTYSLKTAQPVENTLSSLPVPPSMPASASRTPAEIFYIDTSKRYNNCGKNKPQYAFVSMRANNNTLCNNCTLCTILNSSLGREAKKNAAEDDDLALMLTVSHFTKYIADWHRR